MDQISDTSHLLNAAEQYVTQFFAEHISPDYTYHNLGHTQLVVAAARTMSIHAGLDQKDRELISLAAWFHDIGYDQGAVGHEERSCQHVRKFMLRHDCEEEDILQVESCIQATRLPQSPSDLMSQIVCDADMAHLGGVYYWDRCGRIRQELALTRQVIMSDQEWVDFELDFIDSHEYHTDVARQLYDKKKKKHIRRLQKRRLRLNPHLATVSEPDSEESKKKKKKKKGKGDGVYNLKELNLGRGVETMYRTTYRTHVNLSSIADNKANIMLSINAIIISIVVANLVPQFDSNPRLILPTMLLLSVCLVALVYAILSTRPKVTEGKFSREDIRQKRSNLLFFGNFYNMPIDDFHWGMMEMIKDTDFLYSSMTRDLYYLGVVLAKKYRYLSICYTVFMYGLILSVVVFAFVFWWSSKG